MTAIPQPLPNDAALDVEALYARLRADSYLFGSHRDCCSGPYASGHCNCHLSNYQIALPAALRLLAEERRLRVRVEAEVQRLTMLMTDPNAAKLRLRDGGFDVEHWAVKLLVWSFHETFADSGARNWFSLEISPPDAEPLVVTIRRKWGEGPEESIAAVRASAAVLEGERDAAQKRAVDAEHAARTWEASFQVDGHLHSSNAAELLRRAAELETERDAWRDQCRQAVTSARAALLSVAPHLKPEACCCGSCLAISAALAALAALPGEG